MAKHIEMPDIFSQHQMQVVFHKASQTEIIIKDTHWYKGELYFDCLVPQKDEKGNWHFCASTYGVDALDFSKRAEKGYCLIVEQIKN